MRAYAAGCLGVLVLCLTGCGGVGQRPATDTAQSFYAAVQERDGAAACALLVASTRAEVEQSEGKPCARAILEEDIPAGERPVATQVFGTMAEVRYPQETAFLARSDQGWKVLAVACGTRPQGPERPYDCAVTGG